MASLLRSIVEMKANPLALPPWVLRGIAFKPLPFRSALRTILMLAISVSFFIVLAYRIDQTPDIFMDEIIYYRAAFNLATAGNLTWDQSPIFVHPPIQFLTQALFLDLVGLNDTFRPFAGTYVARLVNVFAAAVSAAILFRLIERLSNLRAALIASVVLLMDPFVLRINRRNMLETMAEMWVLAGLYAYWNNRNRLNLRSVLWIGSLFGLAILTKELVFFGYAVIPVFVMLTGRWRDLKKVALIGAIALCIWLLFPFWAWSLGQWGEFVANKAFNFDRLRGAVQMTGWNREGVSFVGALSINVFQYGTSYLLILIGCAATSLSLFIGRSEEHRFVMAWNCITFAFFGYTVAFGTINDQFFYFLMVPVIVINAMMATQWLDLLGRSRHKPNDLEQGLLILNDAKLSCGCLAGHGFCTHEMESLQGKPSTNRNLYNMIYDFQTKQVINTQQFPMIRPLEKSDHYLKIVANRLHRVGWWVTRHRVLANALLAFTLVFGIALQSYNAYRWSKLYAFEEDNALFQLSEYVEENIPAGTTINSMFDTGEPTLQLMLPEYNIVSLRQQAEIEDQHVKYAVLSSKNLWGRYGQITPDYYEWVVANGRQVFSTYGNSFWDVAIYELRLGSARSG